MPRVIALLFALLAPLPALAQATSTLRRASRSRRRTATFVLELDTVRAPLTAENFLRYVRDGFYDGTVFHRVIANFVSRAAASTRAWRTARGHAPIPNESGNGLSNTRGTLGLAREDSPHSGTSQFYINLSTTPSSIPLPSRWGYAVFGRVIEGMEVVDASRTCRPRPSRIRRRRPGRAPGPRRAYVLEDSAIAPAPPPQPAAEKADPTQ